MAVPAFAASQIDFSGYYRTMYISASNMGRQSGDAAFTDSYFAHRLNLEFTFRPTDEIYVNWRVRAPHFDRWGQRAPYEAGSFYTYHLYGVIEKDWGRLLVGINQEEHDTYGLGSLGWVPITTQPYFTKVGVFEDGGNNPMIRYTKRWDNGFQILAQFSNLGTAYNQADTLAAGSPDWSGSDIDRRTYQLEPAFFWDGGGVALNIGHERNAITPAYTPALGFAALPAGAQAGPMTEWYLNPALSHSWGNFSVHFEGKAAWQKRDLANMPAGQPGSVDSSGLGAYLDLNYRYKTNRVNLAGWWVQGTDLDKDAADLSEESKSGVDMGDSFYPLLIAHSHHFVHTNSRYGVPAAMAPQSRFGPNSVDLRTGSSVSWGSIGFANNAYRNLIASGHNALAPLSIAGADNGAFAGFRADRILNANEATRSMNASTSANHWAISINGTHAFSRSVGLSYNFAYLGLNNPNYRVVDRAVSAAGTTGWTYQYAEQSKDLGFEADLGLRINLLDNLTFITAFGYMFNGDAYKELNGYRMTTTDANALNSDTTVTADWGKPKDTYQWINTLNFAF